MEREKVELEESHKRRMVEQGELLVEVESPSGVNCTTLLDCVPDDDALRDSTAACWGSEQDDTEYVTEKEVQEAENLSASPSRLPDTSPTTPNIRAVKPVSKWDEHCEYSLAKVDSNSSLTEQKGQEAKSSKAVANSSGAKVIRTESLDDTAVVIRRKLSFRSELANRIMVTSRTLSRSTVDLASYANEVEMYYDYLLEDATSDIEEESTDDEEQCSNVGADDEKTDKRDKKDKHKPNKDKGKMQAKKEKVMLNKRSSLLKRSSGSVTGKNEVTLRLPQFGREGGENPVAGRNNVAPVPGTLRSRTGTSKSLGGGGGFIRGSSVRASTSRKANTNNAVIVLSGGDGYCDLDVSRSQFKTDDACVQLWLYKY